MKLKILNLGDSLNHTLIENKNIENCRSICDYDALIINPYAISRFFSQLRANGASQNALDRLLAQRRQEMSELLTVTGGVVIWFLSPSDINHLPAIYKYLLPPKQYNYVSGIWQFPENLCIIRRDGTVITEVLKNHPFAQFFSAFQNQIGYQAIIELPVGTEPKPIVLAKNKVNDAIAVELAHSNGKIIFLPIFEGVNSDKLGPILVNCIRSCLNKETVSSPPSWINQYQLTGEDVFSDKLTKIGSEITRLENEREALIKQRDEISSFKGLLFERGKFLLEPLVRRAFFLIGFSVTDPDSYVEEYDVLMNDKDDVIIGEMEGTESSQISVDKYSQLLRYIQEYLFKESKTAKGILIANANISELPEKRGEQFSKETILGCKSQGYCRLTTCELYKVVEVILAAPLEKREALKEYIRKSILSCNGEYKFEEPLSELKATAS